MTKSELQEKIVALYLRLNGYLTTGLIIHSSEETKVDGEIDIVGVRFSNHQQADRLINCSENLDIPDKSNIDVIIGEVKGGNNPLQFNESIREHEDRRYKLLSWIGFLDDKDIEEISKELKSKIQTKEVNSSESFEYISYESKNMKFSIRPIIFAPDKPVPRNNQIKFINGQEMIDFCWKCFRPEFRRASCETDYWSINNWGEQFETLVQYFKAETKTEPGTIKEIYKHFGLNN